MITFRLFDTPIKVKPIVLFDLLIMWAGLSWLQVRWHPEYGAGQALIVGLAILALLIAAEGGHAVAHIFSARYANAPMDEILISQGMPRTLYNRNDVPPTAHRLRATGGLIYNALCLLLSAGLYALLPGGSVSKELAAWSGFAHGLLVVMSLLPLPMIDGGTLLKWTLVIKGRTPAEADALIRRVDWALGVVVVLLGAILLVTRAWVAGGLLVVAGAAILAAAAGMLT